MLYIVEMALSQGHTDADWQKWALEMKTAEVLMTVPGFVSAQRFKGVSDPLAYCGIYGIENAGVMTSEAYKGVGGGVRVQHWNSHITYWNRDIVEGVSIPPGVHESYVLLVKNADILDFDDEGIPFIRLSVTGLNKSVRYKGIAVLPESEGMRVAERCADVRVYKAIGPQLLARA
jgi:hypothetical protein